MLGTVSDEAMDVWRQEIADSAGPAAPAPPRGSVPPPGRPRRPLPRLVPSRPRSATASGVAALAGGVLGAIVTFAHGWPPGDGLLVALALIPVAVGGIEYARTRGVALALGHGVLAGVCGGLAALVIVPVWGFLEFLDCWMSWLADC